MSIQIKKMTVEDYVNKYVGQFPDTEGRKLAKTWDELRLLMEIDLKIMLSDAQNQEKHDTESKTI